jgi:hypothetical protein
MNWKCIDKVKTLSTRKLRILIPTLVILYFFLMIIVYKEAEDINTNTGNIILLSNDHLAQSLHLLSIFYRLFTSLHMADLKALLLRVVSGVNMNTLGVYWVHSKSHMFLLSARFCRRVADSSIYITFMFTPDPLRSVFCCFLNSHAVTSNQLIENSREVWRFNFN